ncbi:MAG: hypothetical protein KDK71_01835 [Chlamydiia bacterium]|nr:hypothetical protein [Chlamydiia bacterium]
MSIVSRSDELKVTGLIEDQLDRLEDSIKSEPIDIAKDITSLARELYNKLETAVLSDPTINQSLAVLLLGGIKTKFYSPFSIVKDLEQFKQSQTPSNERTWTLLCFE